MLGTVERIKSKHNVTVFKTFQWIGFVVVTTAAAVVMHGEMDKNRVDALNSLNSL